MRTLRPSRHMEQHQFRVPVYVVEEGGTRGESMSVNYSNLVDITDELGAQLDSLLQAVMRIMYFCDFSGLLETLR